MNLYTYATSYTRAILMGDHNPQVDMTNRKESSKHKAAQASPNKKQAERLNRRINAYNSLDQKIKPSFTKPGSMNIKKGGGEKSRRRG